MDADGSQPLVALSNRQDVPVDEPRIAELARRTLVAEGISMGELSVSLVSREEMAELHERYLGETGPTDVLSFPQDDPALGDLIGDVVLCPAVAAEQPRDVRDEVALLVVHGVLHLLGYDHEREDDRRAMWERQERYAGVPT